MNQNAKDYLISAALLFVVWVTLTALVTVSVFGMVTVYRIVSGNSPTTAALDECTTLGGTLIISADERYICVPDAKEIDP